MKAHSREQGISIKKVLFILLFFGTEISFAGAWKNESAPGTLEAFFNDEEPFGVIL